jgi:hypothetical protein
MANPNPLVYAGDSVNLRSPVDGSPVGDDASRPFYTGASADQDPVFDTANGTKTSVTSSATVLTPPAGCKYCRISTDADIVVNTNGATAVDDGTAARIIAGLPEIIPVIAGTAVKALSLSGTATVRCTPLKSRP